MFGPRNLAKKLVSLSIVLAAAAPASAATIYVSNSGSDSGCGAKDSPCRSIGAAIDAASAGDSIVVGPGVYGDIDNDGTLYEAGEETPVSCSVGDCVIDVNKAVSITSSAGAFSTILNGGPTTSVESVLHVSTAGVTIGGSGKGFTVLPTAAVVNYGITTDSTATDAVIAGNVVRANGIGISASGQNSSITGNRVIGKGAGSFGMMVSGDAVISGNTVSGTVQGFTTGAGTITFTGNVANGNSTGLYANIASTITVTKSSFVGNASLGIWVYDNAAVTVSSSNIFGNGADGGNCGIQVNAAGTFTGTSNWWGDAAGPGANPADIACGGGSISNTTNASSQLKIKVKSIR